MAISGQQHIRIGAENNSAESDSLHTAFTKIEENFTNLFTNSSQYTTYVAGNGVNVTSNPSLGKVTVTNTGVINLVEGTGVRLSGSNGDVTVSVSGFANGTLVAGVTKVGVLSSTLEVVNSPIISEGNIAVNLPEIDTIQEGEYVAPIVTVDRYGRITSISDNEITGTVTSIAMTAGPGLAITGSPITTSGNIEVTNTGVLRLTAGPGIQLTDATGNITISATTTPISGTVTRVGVTSSALVVTQSPITTSGNINIEFPENITITGDFESNTVTTTTDAVIGGNAEVSGTLTIAGSTTLHAVSSGAITATGNVTGANLVTAGVLTVTGNASVGNIVANIANITTANVTGNVTAGNVAVGNVTATGNISVGNFTTLGNVSTGNLTVTGNLNYNKVFGSFYSNVAQENPVASTAMPITLNNTVIADDISIVDGSKITIAVAGKYNIQFSAQLVKSDSGADVIDIWLAKNGVNEPWTNTDVTLDGSNAKSVAAWNFIVDAQTAGTYYQIMWSSPDTHVSMPAFAAATNPTRPGTPSVIVTVTPVGA